MGFFGPEQSKQLKEAARHSTIGLEIGLSIALGVLGGRWLDGKFDTTPWLTILGFGFGIAAAIRSVYATIQRARAATREQVDATDQGTT